METIQYKEEQKFGWWFYLLAILPVFVVIPIYLIQTSMQPEITTMLVLVGVVLIVAILGLSIKLITKVTKDGISVKFNPFHFSPKKITWDEIEKCYVREYKPIKEYGGWGIRFGFKRGKAFNIKGNKGLQLELKNGKKLLIGTQNPEQLQEVIQACR